MIGFQKPPLLIILSFEIEFPLAPNVFRTLPGRTDSTVDLDGWIELLSEALQIAEPHAFAWEDTQSLMYSGLLYSTFLYLVDPFGK